MKKILILFSFLFIALIGFSQHGTFTDVRLINGDSIISGTGNGTIFYNRVSNKFRFRQNGQWISIQAGSSGAASWGSISGTIGSQTDLVTLVNAKVADAINDGTTTIAPSQNAVFDALALKAPKNNVFYVDDYGAIADSNGTTGNGTDNTTAFVNCMNAVVANGGGTIMLGKGIYRKASRSWTVNGNNIVFRGIDRRVSQLFIDDATTGGGAQFTLIGNNNTISNFTWRSRYSVNGDIGIQISGDQIKIMEMEMYRTNSWAIAASGTNIEIARNIVRFSSSDGIHVLHVRSCNVHNNIIRKTADDAISAGYEDYATSVIIDSNVIDSVAQGIAARGNGGTATLTSGIAITNNLITTTYLAGILVEASQGGIEYVTINNNTIKNAGGYAPVAADNMKGGGVPGGIMINDHLFTVATAQINGVTIANNTIDAPRNGYINVGTTWTFGGGVQGTIYNIRIANNNLTGGVSNLTVGTVAPGSGGGASYVPTPLLYEGIVMSRVSTGEISNNHINYPAKGAVTVDTNCSGQLIVSNNSVVGVGANSAPTYIWNISATAGSLYLSGNANSDNLIAPTTSVYNINSGLTIVANNIVTATGNATDANFTAVANTSKFLPSGTLTANRTITIPAGVEGNVIKYANRETGFAWLLGGVSVYFADETIATQLLANTNYWIEYLGGKWRIFN